MKIYIIQHCQSEHHVNDLTGGWTDTPLTQLGKKQAHAVAKELKTLGLKDFLLYSSDLKRAYMTAEVISNEFSTEIIPLEMLREINNGEAANKTKKWANKNKLYSGNRLEIDKQDWPGSERPRDLYHRMSAFIQKYIVNAKKDLVIVSHGVAISYLISSWLGIAPEMLPNTYLKGNAGGISCISMNQLGQKTLTLFNNTSFLRVL